MHTEVGYGPAAGSGRPVDHQQQAQRLRALKSQSLSFGRHKKVMRRPRGGSTAISRTSITLSVSQITTTPDRKLILAEGVLLDIMTTLKRYEIPIASPDAIGSNR